MKFSIIIPVYNVEQYLEQCIQSVLNQTYQNFEIILIDDGSTDQSGIICDFYYEKYPNQVSVFHRENSGLILARWYGMKCATGDAFVFLDSDDCLRSDALELLHGSFIQNGCDMVLFHLSHKNDFSESNSYYHFHKENRLMGRDDAIRALVAGRMPNCLVTKAVLRHCTENIPDIEKLSHIENGEDLLYSIFLITNAQRIMYLPENLYYYRQREGSIVHTFNPQIMRSIRAVHEVLERYVDIWQMPELHPVQYARAVWGWTDILKILINNYSYMGCAEYRRKVQEVMEDPFFRKAYVQMDSSVLSERQILISKWLYNRNYLPIFFVSILKKYRMRMKKFI